MKKYFSNKMEIKVWMMHAIIALSVLNLVLETIQFKKALEKQKQMTLF